MSHDLRRAFRALWWRTATDSYETAAGSAVDTLWLARMAELGFTAMSDARWSTTPPGPAGPSHAWLGEGVTVLFELSADDGRTLLFATNDALAFVSLERQGSVRVKAAGATVAAAATVVEHIRQRLPKVASNADDLSVPVAFWATATHGPQVRTRKVGCARWADVRENYAPLTRAALERCILAPPAAGDAGKLLLWLGPPGTGKTFALRALAYEQRARVRVHYVLDPEELLGRAGYLASVFRDDDDDDDDDEAEGEAPACDRMRLVILEDSGELLGADAASRVGQGLARLLNMTDGLPGQGLRVQVLITTNEDVGRLHPAVKRPGRCSSLVRFDPFEAEAAQRWLARNGSSASPRSAMSLAELYAVARGDEEPPAARRVGFAMRGDDSAPAA